MIDELVTRLDRQVEEHVPKLKTLDEAIMERPLAPGKWTGKEVLGHLCDSGAINRQRLVRSQYEEPYEFPYYEQATWVRVQGYAAYPWGRLVTQFEAEYQHLVWLLRQLPDGAGAVKAPVSFGRRDFVTVEWLLGHIGRHNDHHLKQIYWLAGLGDLPDPALLTGPFELLPR
ncbi:MAG TPA: DinB family protein [Trueperaceae bacterium]|nr:DinB family protein [Trueperaceae bacterium]